VGEINLKQDVAMPRSMAFAARNHNDATECAYLITLLSPRFLRTKIEQNVIGHKFDWLSLQRSLLITPQAF
jgi:hypothetical protein